MTQLYKKPLVSLTVGELIQAINPIVKRIQEQTAEMLDGFSAKKFDEDEILNADQAAELVGLKKSTIYQKVHHGSIPYFKAPGGKILQFKRSELLIWLESNRKEKTL